MFEQEHTEELEQLQKQKENERIQQELDLAIARIENEQIQRKLDAAIERLEEERSKHDAVIEDADQASQQLLSAVEEVSSQDSITDENSEQQIKIEEKLLTKAKKGYEDQYVILDDEFGVESQSSSELIEKKTTETELQQLGNEQSKRTEDLLEKAQQGYKDQIDVSSSEEEGSIGLLQLREQDEKKQHEMRLTEKGEVKVDKTQIIEKKIKDNQNREDHKLAEARNVRNQKQNIRKIENARGGNQNEEELNGYKQSKKAQRPPKQNLEEICLKPTTINNNELSTMGTVRYTGIKGKKIGYINVLPKNLDQVSKHVQNSVKKNVKPDHLEKEQRILVQEFLMKDQNRTIKGSMEYLQKRKTFFGQRIASDAKFLIKINAKIKKLQKSGNLEIDNEGRVKIRLTKTFETAKTLKNKTIVELRNIRRTIIDEWNIPKTAFQFQKDKMNYKVHSNSKRWTVNLNPKVLRIKTVHGSGGTIVWIKPESVGRELQRLRKTFLAITEKIRKDTEYRKAFVNNKIKQAQD